MKTSKWLALLLSGVMCLSVAALAACDNGKQEEPDNGKQEEPVEKPEEKDPPKLEDSWHNQSIWMTANPLLPTGNVQLPTSDGGRTTTGVSVHDPSVFQDPKNGQYYAFGSHFAVASSWDLIEWEQVARDNQFQQVYGSETMAAPYQQLPKSIEETVNLVKPTQSGSNAITTTWAPDVEYIDGTYYLYYSLTQGFGSNKSAIGRLESDNVLGPYTNNTIILESVTSTASSHPNCIDPELFYDAEGRLWMVYGSHFAGVYIKELYAEGENVGLPKEDGWGTLLWKGGSKVVEGPYIFYNASTEYYYLMTTYGDLTTDYNMRVARSKNPDGPYLDIAGDDMATTSNNGNLHGNKLAGNYKFARTSGNGYAALGHNSVVKDEDGRYFVIYHTRRQTTATADPTAGHNLTVSQLYFNEEGWPVMSPNAYVGEKAGLVTEALAAAEYEIVLHSEETTKTAVNSEDYTLLEGGSVVKGGAEVGSWELKDGYYVEITINNVTYKGVVVPGWDMYAGRNNQRGVLSITAVSDTGRALWAIEK